LKASTGAVFLIKTVLGLVPSVDTNSETAIALRERRPMHWTKWSWLALMSALVIVAVACILFAPDLMALRRAMGK
jgi:hypothetical protein